MYCSVVNKNSENLQGHVHVQCMVLQTDVFTCSHVHIYVKSILYRMDIELLWQYTFGKMCVHYMFTRYRAAVIFFYVILFANVLVPPILRILLEIQNLGCPGKIIHQKFKNC